MKQLNTETNSKPKNNKNRNITLVNSKDDPIYKVNRKIKELLDKL